MRITMIASAISDIDCARDHQDVCRGVKQGHML